MTRCQYCGGPVKWKNEVGWYRDFCESCAMRVADGEDLQATFDPDGEPIDDPEREPDGDADV